MNTSNAKHCVACDECGASLGELYPSNHNNVSVDLHDISKHNSGDSETGYNSKPALASKKTHHFCDEACMASHLTKRSKARAKFAKMSKANQVDKFGNVEIEILIKK